MCQYFQKHPVLYISVKNKDNEMSKYLGDTPADLSTDLSIYHTFEADVETASAAESLLVTCMFVSWDGGCNADACMPSAARRQASADSPRSIGMIVMQVVVSGDCWHYQSFR